MQSLKVNSLLLLENISKKTSIFLRIAADAAIIIHSFYFLGTCFVTSGWPLGQRLKQLTRAAWRCS
jgi:hypothetical protein